MKRVEAKVYGVVQGVNFRHYTQQTVNRLPQVTGWIRNEPDRTVKVVAEGPEASLQQLVEWLHIGSPHGRVDKVDVVWSEATGEFSGFKVRWYG